MAARRDDLRKKGYRNHQDYKDLPADGEWYELKACKECGEEDWIRVKGIYCSRACSGKNANRLNATPKTFLGTTQEYAKFHARVKARRGKADHCINGCVNAKRYEWANLTGHYEDIGDYEMMCSKCHNRYDRDR
jgi:hypothetical protein